MVTVSGAPWLILIMNQGPIILIDGRNLMYRAIFANKKDQRPGSKPHHFTVMARFMRGWLDKFKPSSVNVFWDARKGSLWRRKIMEEYKVRNENEYFEDIREDLIWTQNAARAIMPHMGIRQFSKKAMEADDLIYSACRILSPRSILIVSSDKDYEQVVFRMASVRAWDPMADHGRGRFFAAPDHDPAIAKALAGDKSDKVDGYRNIGPVNSARLARSIEDRQQFLNERGAKIFIRNLLLVDLSLNPDLLKNDLYVQHALSRESKFDKDGVCEAAKKHRVSGLIAEYDRIILPFKLLLEKADEDPEKR